MLHYIKYKKLQKTHFFQLNRQPLLPSTGILCRLNMCEIIILRGMDTQIKIQYLLYFLDK